MPPLVYLAGPISGLSYHATTDWRIKVRRALLPDIQALSPLRDIGQEDYFNASGLASEVAVFERDAFDIRRSDLLLVNFLGAERPSQGTLWELGYARALGKNCIVVMEPSGNPHDTYFPRQSASVRVDNLPEAVEIVRSFLLPG
jgi:nucleoside 2-deoxyribosyltransferase